MKLGSPNLDQRFKIPWLKLFHGLHPCMYLYTQTVSQSQLFHSLNTLHVYWSSQLRLFRRFTSLLLKAAILWDIWFVWWYDVDSCCLFYFQVKNSNITVAVQTLDMGSRQAQCVLLLAGKLDRDVQLTVPAWRLDEEVSARNFRAADRCLLEALSNDGEYNITTLSSTMLFAWFNSLTYGICGSNSNRFTGECHSTYLVQVMAWCHQAPLLILIHVVKWCHYFPTSYRIS